MLRHLWLSYIEKVFSMGTVSLNPGLMITIFTVAMTRLNIVKFTIQYTINGL